MNWVVQSSSRSTPPATTPLPFPALRHSSRAFADRGDVVFAEPSEMSFNSALTYIPHDTDFPRLWSPHNTAQVVNGVVGRADADIDATEAWDITRGDRNVIVAVIDTGAELDHPDLAANFRPWGTEDWDCAAAGDPVSDDVDGHGTQVRHHRGGRQHRRCNGCRPWMPFDTATDRPANRHEPDPGGCDQLRRRALGGQSGAKLRHQLQLAHER